MTCSFKTALLLKELSIRQTCSTTSAAGPKLIALHRSVLYRIPECMQGGSSSYYKLFSALLVLLTLSATVNMAHAEISEFAKKSSEFTVDLFSKVTEGREKENVIISPFSIQTCVALAYVGATGKTADEMAKGLRLISADKSEVATSFGRVLDEYKNNPLLKIANKVYVMSGYELKPEFNEIATKSFHSEAQNINFANSGASAKEVNGWVEDKTNNKIKNLFTEDSFNSDTRCVLVNAIYFKGFWEKKFDKEATRKDDFWVSETESVKVDMMFTNSKFKYGELRQLDASAVELPYKDSNMSMLVILPNSKTGLKDLEAKLNTVNLAEITSHMYETDVNLKLPKFEIEFSIELNEPLKKMGMTTMFEGGEFGNLLKTSEPLKVSKVVHKAFIEVNEEGSEAAAATGLIGEARIAAIPRQLSYFYADHPFFFMLKSKENILFAGRYLKV